MKTQYIRTYGMQQKHSKRGVHSNKCLHFLKNISNKQPSLSVNQKKNKLISKLAEGGKKNKDQSKYK